jgi:2-keto-4-pentenoate hydratase
MRLLVWLANIGSRAAGGLRAGSMITTGSLTGMVFVSPPVHLRAELPGLGTVSVSVK